MGYFRKRVLTSIVVFFVVVNITFILPRLVPGNAAEILASGSKVPQVQIHLLELRFGLDQPVYVQYLLYLKNTFATWPPDFGYSFLYYPSTVSSLFAVRLGWTLLLILSSLAVGLLAAYAAVAISSLRRGGKFEFTALYAAILFNSTPIFFTAIVLVFVFGVNFRVFPIFGSVDFNPGPGLGYFESVLWHAILPIATLSTSVFGWMFLLLRGSTQEVLKSDYVFASKSRGLKDRIVATGYILRNSLLPLVSISAFSLATLVSQVVLVEVVFGYPGIGDLIADAVGGRDYPVLQGSLFYLAAMIIVAGLIGDLILMRLDPRVGKS